MFHSSRGLKCTKMFSSFSEVWLTICNKLLGLVNSWPQVLVKTSPATHCWPSTWMPTMPSSSLSATPSPSTSYWQPQPSLVMLGVDSFNPVMSVLDTVTPLLSQQSLPFHLNTQGHQSVNDISQQFFQAIPALDTVKYDTIKYPPPNL